VEDGDQARASQGLENLGQDPAHGEPGETEEVMGVEEEKMKKQMKQARKTILMKEKTENEKPLRMSKTPDHTGSRAASENQPTDWNSQISFLNKPERHANGQVPESERSARWMLEWQKGYFENPKWPTGSSENLRMAAGV